MSRLATQNGDDHPEAAGKHLEDAATLFVHDRYDGAAYLAGYVIECSLKSVILLAGACALQRIHNLNALSADAIRFASMPMSRTARYTPRQTAAHAVYAAGTGWRETLRYRPERAISDATAAAWIEEAENVYASTVAQMWRDGVL